MRVVIVLPGALGDVVRALPLLGRLRRARPDAWLAWVVEPPSAPLLRGHPWLDDVLLFDRPRGVRAVVPLLRRVRAAGFDVALDLGRSIKSALIARASGAPDRLGFAPADGREGSWLFATRHIPPQGEARSKLEQFFAFGDALGLPPAPVAFGLEPTPEERREADSFVAGLGAPLVAACVGSSCPSRRWFPEPTAATLRALRARFGARAVLLGTEADRGFAAAVVAHAGEGVRDLTGRTTLRQLMAVLARARLAFGPDSGALHLAAALGTPAVSLWGATSPLRSAPLGSEALVLAGEAPCAPCFLARCPIDRVCMRAIGVDDILGRAAAALAA
jgi:lipopolysaccharide heptosyltransferase II